MSETKKNDELRDSVLDIISEFIELDHFEILSELASSHEEIVHCTDTQYIDMVAHYEDGEEKIGDLILRVEEVEDFDIGSIQDRLKDLDDIDLDSIEASLSELEDFQLRISEQEEELDDLRESIATLEERISILEKNSQRD